MTVEKSSGVRKNVKTLKIASWDPCTILLDSVICLVLLGALCAVVLKIQCCGGANCNL